MTTRRNAAVSLALVCAVVALSYAGRFRGAAHGADASVPTDALAVVPADATGILRVDVARLLGSRLWQRLVHARGADRGLEELRRTCHFDPLEGAHDLVVFVRGEGREPLAHVGFVLRGRFDTERIASCVGRALSRDGATLRRTRVAGLPAIAGGRGDSRFAFVGDRALLGGSEETVEAIADVITAGAANATTGELAAAYRQVSEGADLVLVAKAPRRWLRALRENVAIARPGLESALSEPPLLSLGARLRQDVALDLRLRLSDATSAQAVSQATRSFLTETAENAALRLMGVGDLPGRVHVSNAGPSVRLQLALEGTLLDHTLGLVEQGLPAPVRTSQQGVERAAPQR